MIAPATDRDSQAVTRRATLAGAGCPRTLAPTIRWMRLDLTTWAIAAALCLTTPACSARNPDEAKPLTVFGAQNVRYELGLYPNSQGPDAPCVGVSHSNADGSSVTMACPTEDDEETTYTATLEAGSGFFVVGYGIEANETITAEGAVQTTITQDQSGRYYFAIELRADPGPDPFDLKVTSPEGSTRSIPSHGLTR